MKTIVPLVSALLISGCSMPSAGAGNEMRAETSGVLHAGAQNSRKSRPENGRHGGRSEQRSRHTDASRCDAIHAGGTEPKVVDARLSRLTASLCFRAFAVLHSGVSRTPIYVSELLTRASVDEARILITRDNRFHPEPRLAVTERSELADYRGSGYDRGHMAPSGDMGDPDDDFDSFSLANIVPQDAQLNRHGWAELEGYVRDLAESLGTVYVVTGPAFLGTDLDRLHGRVLVPSHVWKAAYVPGQGAGAWIVTNDEKQQWETISIADLTTRVGIDPFPTLDRASKTRVPAFPTFER
ncbi:DNA/RNA non-specific endonuclease [Sphingomonas sp.]|uniref:DNA/RNA non-specific endonuclease n=1 Tax=Sphingomonas sp. TaxID=28214 RepID=UPI000DBBDAA8|nr:MAG: DNA/RNA non-specific endonuclease [Sphingomonas sp.]